MNRFTLFCFVAFAQVALASAAWADGFSASEQDFEAVYDEYVCRRIGPHWSECQSESQRQERFVRAELISTFHGLPAAGEGYQFAAAYITDPWGGASREHCLMDLQVTALESSGEYVVEQGATHCHRLSSSHRL
jgi:hypothetical protein